MAELQFVLRDIRSASIVFQMEGAKYAGIVPDSGPSVPGGIDESLHQALSLVLPAIGLMHDAVAGCMKTHARKLRYASDTYQKAEVRIQRQADALLKAIADPSGLPSATGDIYGPPS